MSTPSTEIALLMVHHCQRTPAPQSPLEWWLWPAGRRLRRAALHDALEALPRPVILAAHAEAGAITAIPLENASAESRAYLEHECRNQADAMRLSLDRFAPGGAPVRVLLELEDWELVVQSTELLQWSQEYAITSCGWSLADSGGDPRAPLRMLLRSPDGRWSPGLVCHHD